MSRLRGHFALLLVLCGIMFAPGDGSALARPAPSSSGSSPSDSGSAPPGTTVGRLVQDALENNLSLKQERISLEQRRAARTDFLPTVSLAVDAGIQGTAYGFSGDKPFASASVVLEWTLFDGLTTHRRVQRRRLETKRLRTRRNRVGRQLTQKVHKSFEAVRVARQSLQTAQARAEAARESSRLTRRRHGAGRANQAALIDARTALTEAELNRNVTRYDLLIHLAELEHAAGLAPIGSQK